MQKQNSQTISRGIFIDTTFAECVVGQSADSKSLKVCSKCGKRGKLFETKLRDGQYCASCVTSMEKLVGAYYMKIIFGR